MMTSLPERAITDFQNNDEGRNNLPAQLLLLSKTTSTTSSVVEEEKWRRFQDPWPENGLS
eukprot:scaffold158_cov105-Cylindrotheca_fusiformis.AAC.16